MIEIKDDAYIKHPDPKALNAFAVGEPKIITGNIKEIVHSDPTCMLIHPHEHNVEALLNDLNRFHADTVSQLSWGAPWHIVEIVRPDINKAVGLKRVAEEFSVPPERIIAFGDEMNDKEMLAFAGKGIAMGNAADAIKEIADDITLTNEEDGIAHYLEKLFVLA
jgi:hydroxymethylpyrimidine pyrophosphatase-like HAD family hydrolase